MALPVMSLSVRARAGLHAVPVKQIEPCPACGSRNLWTVDAEGDVFCFLCARQHVLYQIDGVNILYYQ